MTIRALVELPEPESTTLHAVTFTNTDAGSGVVVVRLVPEALIPAEEATLQVLGLVPTRSREVGHTTTRSVGFPAWVISTHPADTRQALRLVSDLEWARNTMPKVAKIEKKFATILADLGDSAPHFVPTLMEELARIFAAGGKQAAAKRAFAKAREFEHTYDLPVDSWRHRAAATEFAALGIIGAADMTREARAASSRCANPQEAYKYFLSLCINQIRAGGQAYAGMLRDIIRLGKAAGHSAANSGVHLLDGIAGSPALKTVPWQFYKELAEHIRPAATRKPELYARLFAHSTTQIDQYGSDPGEWFTMISDLGVVDIIASDQRVFVSWLANIIELEPYTPRRNGGDLTPIIRGIRDKADLVRGQHIPANIAKIPLEILATLTTAGATWDKKPDQQPMGESNQWRRVLQRLRHCHAGVLDLSALCADAELLAATLGDFSLADIPHHAVPTLVACGGTGLFDALTQAALDELARANHPLIGRTNFRKLVGGIPSQTLSPTTRAAITHHFDISPATILAANLHAGLLTEYTWPELENRWAGVDKRPTITLWESYPGVIVATPDRIAYIENDTTVSEHDHVDTNSDAGQIAVGENILTIRYVAGTIGFNAEWATGVPQPLNLHQWQHGHYELSTNTLLIPAGRLYGGGIARHADAAATDVPGTEITMPEGNAFGDNDGHAWHTVLRKDPWSETYAIRQVNPETGRALGPSQPEALRSLGRTTATPIDWGRSTQLPTRIMGRDYRPHHPQLFFRQEPHDPLLLCAILKPHDGTYPLIDADGITHTSPVGTVGYLHLHGVTYLYTKDGQLLRSGTSELAMIANPTYDKWGNRHFFHDLPWNAWRNLTIRSPKASEALRGITEAQAQQLLDSIPAGNPHQVAANLLGLDADDDLCTSVVQAARRVQEHCKPR